MENNDENKTPEPFKVMPLALNLGFSIAVPLVLFALLGRYLDGILGTSPWLLLVSIGIAITTSMIVIYQKVKEYLK